MVPAPGLGASHAFEQQKLAVPVDIRAADPELLAWALHGVQQLPAVSLVSGNAMRLPDICEVQPNGRLSAAEPARCVQQRHERTPIASAAAGCVE